EHAALQGASAVSLRGSGVRSLRLARERADHARRVARGRRRRAVGGRRARELLGAVVARRLRAVRPAARVRRDAEEALEPGGVVLTRELRLVVLRGVEVVVAP